MMSGNQEESERSRKKRTAVEALISDVDSYEIFKRLPTFSSQITFIDKYINEQLERNEGVDYIRLGNEYSRKTDYHHQDSMLCREICMHLMENENIVAMLPQFYTMPEAEHAMPFVKNFGGHFKKIDDRMLDLMALFRDQLLLPGELSLTDITDLIADAVVTFPPPTKQIFDEVSAPLQLQYFADVLLKENSEQDRDHWPKMPLCYYVNRMIDILSSARGAASVNKCKWDELTSMYMESVIGMKPGTSVPLFESIILIAEDFDY